MKQVGIKLILATFLFSLYVFISRGNTGKNVLSSTSTVNLPSPSPQNIQFPEIKTIITSSDLAAQSKEYLKLIERVGPEKAQDALYQSGLPFDGQTHLLNHTIGDWLYEKYGVNGLTHCKDYFLSSCFHGFVIAAIGNGGVEILDRVMDTCWSLGVPTATQCSHAIGHGFLAWRGYKNLLTALADCDNLNKQLTQFPLFSCYDGIFMENIWAIHEGGKPSPDRWLKNNDPIYPCNEAQIPEKYKNACWSNQPSWMYQLFGGDIKRIGEECLKVTNQEYQKTCFDSLARQIHPLTAGNQEKVFALCGLIPNEWQDQCVSSIAKAAFTVGDHELPFVLCDKLEEQGKNACYELLVPTIAAYIPDVGKRASVCEKINNGEWKNKCKI